MSEPAPNLDRQTAVDGNGASVLLPQVYEELRRLAAQRLAQEAPGQTLQATALVHEAWLRLAGAGQPWSGRAHFFAAAAEAMRRILIDQARRKASAKHGGGWEAGDLNESQIELPAPADEILAVHDAVDRLAAEDAPAAQVVKLRYFVGLSNLEVSEVLGMSPRSVDRHWAYARAWLKSHLSPPKSV